MVRRKKKQYKLFVDFVVVFLMSLLLFSFFKMWQQHNLEKEELLTQDVLQYENIMLKYARENNIEEYVDLMQAMMMQESAGLGSDPMQSSECEFNTKYKRKPGAIQDSEYSIEVGVRYFAKCLDKAGVKSIYDEERLFLALQSYNYGVGYVRYVENTSKKYTYQNAIDFSEKCKREQGISVYGDPKYVYHVLRYYKDTSLVDKWLKLYR